MSCSDDATTILNSCTVSGNSATGDGGGLATSPPARPRRPTPRSAATPPPAAAVRPPPASPSTATHFRRHDRPVQLHGQRQHRQRQRRRPVQRRLQHHHPGRHHREQQLRRRRRRHRQPGHADGRLRHHQQEHGDLQGRRHQHHRRHRDDHQLVDQQQPGQRRDRRDRPGGGIDSENTTLSLSNDTINSNQANGATAFGGGIYLLDGSADLEGCTISSNQANGSTLGEGGGIYDDGTLLTLDAATKVKKNTASTLGGNIFVRVAFETLTSWRGRPCLDGHDGPARPIVPISRRVPESLGLGKSMAHIPRRFARRPSGPPAGPPRKLVYVAQEWHPAKMAVTSRYLSRARNLDAVPAVFFDVAYPRII